MTNEDTFDYSRCSLEFPNDYVPPKARDRAIQPLLDRREAERKASAGSPDGPDPEPEPDS